VGNSIRGTDWRKLAWRGADNESMIFRFLRSPRFKIMVGVSLALVGMAYVTAKSKVDGRWDEMKDRLAEVRGELESMSNVREPLGGVATEGIAWEAYDEAFAWMKENVEGNDMFLALQAASESGAGERRLETHRLALELAIPLAAIQRGARCHNATRPMDWSVGFRHDHVFLWESRVLVDVLTLLGLAEIESGEVESGCAKILDALQLGQDMALSPMLITQLIGTSQTVPGSLRDFLEREGLGALPREALVSLEKGYATLIGRAPIQTRWNGELVTLGNAVQLAYEKPSNLFGIEGFSGGPVWDLVMRWNIAEDVLRMAQVYAILEGLNAEDHLQHVQTVGGELKDSGNLVLMLKHKLLNADAALRYNLVKAGQLQRALRRALELPEVPFPDPLEMPLTETDDGKVMSFHSDHYEHGIELSVKY
jgi:hypothetical protein